MDTHFELEQLPSEQLPETSNNILNTLNAVLIAVVVVIGAVVAWRASIAADAAGDADYAGLRAIVNVEETRALNTVNAYQSYLNYLEYWSNKRQGELLSQEIETSPKGAENENLDAQMRSAFDLSYTAQLDFDNKFLNRDGSYSFQRQMGQLWANALKEKEMDFVGQFDDAEKMRKKTIYLLLCVMILSIAPVFYSLVETVSEQTKRILLIMGSLFAVSGTLLSLMVEFGKIPF